MLFKTISRIAFFLISFNFFFKSRTSNWYLSKIKFVPLKVYSEIYIIGWSYKYMRPNINKYDKKIK